ncbi:hypothetical protein A3765_01290 [Oleiphilus sp. HI0130]|nr:hypothetical protein A3758_10375 [Oleiphilus sp. HI0118]KZZ77039.1 hypothetical protein A3765_01290 [Oleiphilus sp. HI0130]
MKLMKVATSSALVAALSLSVGCASTPDAEALGEEPSQSSATSGPNAAGSDQQITDQEVADQEVSAQDSAAEEAVSEDADLDRSGVDDSVTSSKAQTEQVASEEAALKAAGSALAASEASGQSNQSEMVTNSADSASSELNPVAVSAAEPEAASAEPRPQSTSAAEKEIAPVPVKAEETTGQRSLENALDVSRKDLPVTVDIWTLRQSFEQGEDLVLSTPTLQMGDGDYLSQIRLILKSDQLVIDSSSDIDANLEGVGVRINGSEIIPLDRMEGSTIGIVEGDWMSRFAEGGTIEILLGFFPDKSTDSPVFAKEASLDALSKLVPTYYKLQ